MSIKKFNTYLILFSFSFFIYSQDIELEKEYLNSLPDSVREDVLKEVKTQQEKENQDIFRRPSTALMKYETVRKWEKFLKESYIEPSERFGSQIFQSMQTSFMPINEPNFDGTYILDYGDILEIQLIGQKSKKYKLEVARDGSISLPDMEKIVVGGLSLNQANKVLKARLNNSFLGTEGYITIKEVRDIQILITGEASFPGIYTLSGNTNVLHALNVAGGIKENASYRKIDIRRNGELLKTVDLYDMLVFGDIPFVQSLKSGDTILVNNAKKIVRISGGVNRAAKYELKDDETLENLISFANNFSYNSSNDPLIYEQINGDEIISSKIDRNSISSITPKPGSSFYVPFNNFKEIELTGQVKRPGKYTITENDTISSIINRAGGYKTNAYPFGGLLSRKSVIEFEKKMHERFYKDLVSALATDIRSQAIQNGGGSEAIPALLMEIKDHKPSGRLQAEFDLMKINQDPSLDTRLEDRDKIHIPSLQKVVYVFGEVRNPGSIQYKSGDNVNSYINRAGSYSFYADKKYTILVSPDGSSSPISQGLFGIDGNTVYPGSLIYVPRKIGQYDGISLVSVISPIFSSFALSLASINALDD